MPAANRISPDNERVELNNLAGSSTACIKSCMPVIHTKTLIKRTTIPFTIV